MSSEQQVYVCPHAAGTSIYVSSELQVLVYMCPHSKELKEQLDEREAPLQVLVYMCPLNCRY